MRVLADVGETLGNEIEGRHLEALRQPAADIDAQPYRHRAARRELLERHLQPVSAHHGRVEPTGDVPELLQRRRDLSLCPIEAPARLGVVPYALLPQSQLEGQSDEALLSPVMQVPLEPLALRLSGLDDPRP